MTAGLKCIMNIINDSHGEPVIALYLDKAMAAASFTQLMTHWNDKVKKPDAFTREVRAETARRPFVRSTRLR